MSGAMSHDEIGRRLGLSRQRVQQLEQRALRKMRAVLRREAAQAERRMREAKQR